MGALVEAAVPAGRRWIPKGMQVEYVGRATSGMVCVAETNPTDWEHDRTSPCG